MGCSQAGVYCCCIQTAHPAQGTGSRHPRAAASPESLGWPDPASYGSEPRGLGSLLDRSLEGGVTICHLHVGLLLG